MSNIAYRPDIDGLRAIAVLMVLIYHAGFKFVSGGYIGVDIFFVISGFLITSIIVREIQSSSFTFAKFYIRRMKRILPAFYAVGFATIVAAYFLLLPLDYKQLTNSFFAASIFASNFFFWLKSGGYFVENAGDMPLLHTWSLAVEEQFYIVWPVTLLVLYRWLPKKALVPLTIALIVLSFGLGEWGARHYPDLAYYMLPARVGELLLGALLALMPKLGSNLNKNTLNVLSIAGLIILITPGFVLTRQSYFPGLNAFWPCLGTAILIMTGRDQAVVNHRLLSVRPMVFIGIISYSLYLWHWPLVAFVNYFEIEKTLIVSFAIVVVSFLLAILSWKFIEQPFRHIDLSFLKMWFRMFAAPVCISLVICLLVRENQGFEDRFFIKGWKSRAGTVSPKNCLSASPENYSSKCILGEENARATFVVWGDSFADTLVQTISESAKAQGKSGLALIKHSCPSISGTVRNDPGVHLGQNFSSECEAYTDSIFEYLQKNSSIETVILNSAYNWYLHASTEAGEPILTKRDTGEGHEEIALALADTANKLVNSGRKVIIIMPHFEHNRLRAAILNYEVFASVDSLAIGSGVSTVPHEKLDSLLDEFALDKAVHRIYPLNYLCKDDENCKFIDASGNLVVSDGHHLSKTAVEKIVSGFANLLY